MADQEGTAQTSQFIVISEFPDVCKSPSVPVPYQIVGYLDQSIFTSPNVRFKGYPVFDMGSRVTTVTGDEAGTGGGVVSGVNRGFCRPITPVPTVRCNGLNLCRHEHTKFFMNCAGPEGPGNTIGKVVYLGAMASANVSASGTLPPGSNPSVTGQTPSELGFLAKIGDLAKDFEDVVALAKKAYDIAQTDWSDPSAVLGAIGGVAGLAGLGGLAKAASLGKKAYDIAKTDWSNPGAALSAAMGLAGLVKSTVGGGSSLSSLGSELFDDLQKLWNLPNSALGLVYGAAGHLYGEVGNVLGYYDPEPYWDTGNNALQFHNNPFMPSAMTLGNVIIYGGGKGNKSVYNGYVDADQQVGVYDNSNNLIGSVSGPAYGTVGGHESKHTEQGEILGPLYIPYALGSYAVGTIAGGGTHGPNSSIERSPQSPHGTHGTFGGPGPPVIGQDSIPPGSNLHIPGSVVNLPGGRPYKPGTPTPPGSTIVLPGGDTASLPSGVTVNTRS